VFIRQPTTAGPDNIPAGTTSWNGRLANVPNPLNAQYYPDTSLTPKQEYNPETKQYVTVYPFNTSNPMSGDPVPENAQGYLMRNTQWLVQDLGVDFFRLDAVKNMPSWELEYYDQAVYGASNRTLLNGQKELQHQQQCGGVEHDRGKS
jgi:glycosidase